MNLIEIHEQAKQAANIAANHYLQTKLGGRDSFPCGFCHVEITDKIRANSKLGKALEGIGFDKAYSKLFHSWNFCDVRVQNVDVQIAGATAYANVLIANGINAKPCYRLD